MRLSMNEPITGLESYNNSSHAAAFLMIILEIINLVFAFELYLI